MRQIVSQFHGSVGVYAKNLKTSETYGYNADELFCTASTFKLPVMVELFRRADAGKLSLNDRRKVSATASRHGTGMLKVLKDSAELSLHDYCRLMIIYSDNVATDTLMEIIDSASVTRTMERLGFPNTRVSGNVTKMHYGMIGIDSSVGSPDLDAQLLARARTGTLVIGGFVDRSRQGNVTTPREMGTLLEKLHNGQVVSPKASEQMLDIMKQTTDRKIIPKHLPTGIEVAHKVGGTWRVKADVGIAYLETGPVVMALFVYCDPKEQRKAETLAELARLIADWSDGSQ